MARDLQIMLRAIAVIAAALAAAVQLNGQSAPERSAVDLSTDDPLRAELERCRTITPEDLATGTVCQTAWVENRRRFFAPASDDRNKE